MHRAGFIGAGICLFASLAVCASARSAAPLLLRNPSLSQDKIAFLYADNIWVVAREGGDAQRLTAIGAVDAGATIPRITRRSPTRRIPGG